MAIITSGLLAFLAISKYSVKWLILFTSKFNVKIRGFSTFLPETKDPSKNTGSVTPYIILKPCIKPRETSYPLSSCIIN